MYTVYANMCVGEELERKAFIAITVIKDETSGGVHRDRAQYAMMQRGRGYCMQ